MLFFSHLSIAQTDEDIEKTCKTIFPSLVQTFERHNCVKSSKKDRKIAEAKRIIEESSRPCLAKEIPELENELKKISKAINFNDSVTGAVTKLNNLNLKPEMLVSDDNIKEMIIVFSLFSSCTSDFHFLINIREGIDKKLKSFNVWALNSPRGYQSGYLDQFNVNYVQLRKSAEIEKNKKAQQSNAKNDQAAANLASALLVPNNPCAPNLTKSERLAALAKEGTVKQTSQNSFIAGRFSLSFNFDGTLRHCY